ncbi:histidine phosphatase family protein [Bdellovibrio sp. HCB337]|uniref:histidine phosphatase family protein n=1 Tax=Bdellovibrio sp. HCB337 TaxID=3394358 RepID=UPI0039A47048
MELDPKVYRKIIFIRHGQYSSTPEQLTRLGRQQAQWTAKAVALLKPSKIHCSSMPRAIETANIISEKTGLQFKPSDLFREGKLPGTVDFHKAITKGMTAKEKKEMMAKIKLAKKNADLAFKKLFKKPQRGQTTEIVVAHGNVIRHWVCKALGIPEENWLKMDVSHTSLTTITISKKGNFVLLGFADTGHLPVSARTYV